MLGTGGTIASAATGEGLAPRLSSNEILTTVPEIKKICTVEAVQVLNLDSTNIGPEHWLSIAGAIHENYDAYDGFVVLHGTDTMAYTAAALSYLIQGSDKPIVLTGAQKSILAEDTDSRRNLHNSFSYAAYDGSAGVTIVFDGRVILGTRARKVRSKSFDAFMSINYPDLASVQDGKILPYIALPKDASPVFFDKLNPRVALLKLVPGTDASVLEYLFSQNDAVIIESFGVGGVPQLAGAGYMEAIDRALEGGKLLVMTTQVQLEGSDIGVYETGHALKGRAGILEAYDMTSEATLTKMMWILGQTRDPIAAARLFYRPVAHDLLYTNEALGGRNDDL